MKSALVLSLLAVVGLTDNNYVVDLLQVDFIAFAMNRCQPLSLVGGLYRKYTCEMDGGDYKVSRLQYTSLSTCADDEDGSAGIVLGDLTVNSSILAGYEKSFYCGGDDIYMTLSLGLGAPGQPVPCTGVTAYVATDVCVAISTQYDNTLVDGSGTPIRQPTLPAAMFDLQSMFTCSSDDAFQQDFWLNFQGNGDAVACDTVVDPSSGTPLMVPTGTPYTGTGSCGQFLNTTSSGVDVTLYAQLGACDVEWTPSPTDPSPDTTMDSEDMGSTLAPGEDSSAFHASVSLATLALLAVSLTL